MATISLYLSSHDEKLIKNYAKSKNMSASDFLRSVAIEKIEDDLDNQIYEKSLQEYRDNPQDVSLEALKKELSLYC